MKNARSPVGAMVKKVIVQRSPPGQPWKAVLRQFEAATPGEDPEDTAEAGRPAPGTSGGGRSSVLEKEMDT